MRKPKTSEVDIDYLRRAQKSTPEQRLDWLAAACEFAAESRKSVTKKKR